MIKQGLTTMDKGKIVAIITGAISILIAIAYLVLVQLIDFRGEMIPAPIDQLSALRVQHQLALPVNKYISTSSNVKG